MNGQDASSSVAAPEARFDLPISAFRQGVGSGEHTEAQNHDRNELGGDTFDVMVGDGQPSFGQSRNVAPAAAPDLDNANSKGKARNDTALEGLQQAVHLDDTANTQLQNSEGDDNERDVIVSESLPPQTAGQRRPPAMTAEERMVRQMERKIVRRTKQVMERERANDSNGESSVPPRRDLTTRQSTLDRRQSDPGEPASASTTVQASLPHRSPGNANTFWENIETIRRGSIEDNHLEGEASTPVQQSQTDGSLRMVQKARAKSDTTTRGMDVAGSSARAAHPGYLTPTPNDGDSSLSRGSSPLLSHISPSQIRQGDARQRRTEVIVPRWQPDAEVTICPICGTQFSFFVRKHHCRKCGRVVCNSCSPHRITIPYQFIVQPPAEVDALNATSSRARPALDPTRAGRFLEVESLGGGERVRLCNPCVPDPNTAPPQTTQFDNQRQPTQRSSHSRSISNAATSSYSNFTQAPTMSRSGNNRLPGDPQREQLDSYHSASNPNATGSRAFTFSPQSDSTGSNSNNGSPFRGPRSRSSTVAGGTNDAADNGTFNRTARVPTGLSQISNNASLQAQYRSLIPRDEQSLQRPLPRLPRPPRIAEEDECPVCHQELPSNALPNSEALRAAHINNCIESALRGTSSTPPPPPTTSTQAPRTRAPSASSSVPVPAPIANTPEARMAAREQAHAAVVLGHTSSPSPAFRRTGVFPYKATEKDCVDDAECTICLEEFEVGQDMGRLECFCRFHLLCIREWFVNHYGQCPVHHRPEF